MSASKSFSRNMSKQLVSSIRFFVGANGRPPWSDPMNAKGQLAMDRAVQDWKAIQAVDNIGRPPQPASPLKSRADVDQGEYAFTCGAICTATTLVFIVYRTMDCDMTLCVALLTATIDLPICS